MLVSKLNLEPGETVIFEARKHWFVFLLSSAVLVLGALAPLILFIIFSSFFAADPANLSGRASALLVFFYLIWLLVFWVLFFIKWTNYFLDVWFITEKRIIDVDQKGLFHREVSNLRFDKIQDVTIEVRGIIPTFLNFGDLKVQTAAEDSSSFFMKNANRPEEVRKIIFARHNKESEKPASNVNAAHIQAHQVHLSRGTEPQP